MRLGSAHRGLARRPDPRRARAHHGERKAQLRWATAQRKARILRRRTTEIPFDDAKLPPPGNQEQEKQQQELRRRDERQQTDAQTILHAMEVNDAGNQGLTQVQGTRCIRDEQGQVRRRPDALKGVSQSGRRSAQEGSKQRSPLLKRRVENGTSEQPSGTTVST